VFACKRDRCVLIGLPQVLFEWQGEPSARKLVLVRVEADGTVFIVRDDQTGEEGELILLGGAVFFVALIFDEVAVKLVERDHRADEDCALCR
jgi:hypothetical protein